jgi:3-phosphoshikimate 1-carboxyvinyltransferase
MMALPLLDGDSVISLTTEIASKPYIDITLQVLKNFGITITESGNKFIIKGGQKFIPNKADVEGDWSNASFFLVGGAIGGDVTVSGLNLSSLQGDKVIVDILKSANANVEIFADKVRVKKSDLTAFTFNADNCPDLVPIASILAGASKGQSVITNISRLKIKESDRVESTIKMLSAFGVSAFERDDNLYINGTNGQFLGGTVSSFNDHRIAMSAAIGGLIAKNTVIIDGAEAVNKSYPDFYNNYVILGGKVND